jgi:hypothetical protein
MSGEHFKKFKGKMQFRHALFLMAVAARRLKGFLQKVPVSMGTTFSGRTEKIAC